MAEAVILSAVEKLEIVLVKKGGWYAGEELEVKGLRDDLRGMLSLFTDKSGDYISRVTEIAHQADVAIDAYILHLQEMSETKSFMRRFFSTTSQSSNFVAQIYGIRQSLKVLWCDFSRSEEVDPTTRSTVAVAVQVEVGVGVEGMKEDVELVLRKAIFSTAQLGLATSCIVGMGGVGKTTLARILYTHQRVVSQFQIRAWVYVSSEFSSKEVLKELILQFGMDYDDDDDEHEDEPSRLRDMVFQHLHTIRYFIVLDHVWRHKHLDFVFTAFPPNACGRLQIQ